MQVEEEQSKLTRFFLRSAPMAKVSLSGMNVESLMDLRKRVDDVLRRGGCVAGSPLVHAAVIGRQVESLTEVYTQN